MFKYRVIYRYKELHRRLYRIYTICCLIVILLTLGNCKLFFHCKIINSAKKKLYSRKKINFNLGIVIFWECQVVFTVSYLIDFENVRSSLQSRTHRFWELSNSLKKSLMIKICYCLDLRGSAWKMYRWDYWDDHRERTQPWRHLWRSWSMSVVFSSLLLSFFNNSNKWEIWTLFQHEFICS